MANNLVIAEYLRISSDDGVHGDSQSIINQRDLIDCYICGSEELCGAKRIEFCDDGFSGVNFNRPDMQKLLAAIKCGKINCVIVKDLSRFGRNYIEVGDYIEQIFPFLNIRFISINDNYDSARKECSAGDVSTSFKNLCNDYYCKDLSRKVKSGMRTKWLKGDFLSTFPVYGYQKDNTDFHKLVVDHSAADIVKRIFSMAVAGDSAVKIATTLNHDKVKTPMEYLCEKCKKALWSKLPPTWSSTKVINIIRYLRYTGAMVNGKYEVNYLGSGSSHKTSSDKWYITENMHEPLVSKQDFDAAQNSIRKIKSYSAKTNVSPFTFPFHIRCGGCGHALVKNSAKQLAYYCKYKNTISNNTCTSDKILFDGLCAVLLSSIQGLFKLAETESGKNSKGNINKAPILKQKQECQKKIDMINSQKLALYFRYSDNEILLNQYTKEKSNLDKKLTELNLKLTALEENSCAYDQSPLQAVLCELSYPTSYSHDIASALIESVIVYDAEHIEIKWKFDNSIENPIN